MSAVTHDMMIGPPCFPVFNNRKLSNDPIQPGDIVPFERSESAGMKLACDVTWSSGCEWYFMVLPEGIVLLTIHSRSGLLCKRHSAAFIELCLSSGILSKTLFGRRAKRGYEQSPQKEG